MRCPPQYQSNPSEEKKEDQASLKPLKWTKPFRKHKANSQVLIWGKAIPRNMFPQNQDQLTPWKSDQLSSKNIWDITTAKEGQHCLAIGKNDWCFVWGETKHSGALGLGNGSRSTSPFRLNALAKQSVKQACCSAVHSLCITDAMCIYGWGSKSLTLLNRDTVSPTPLHYLNGKGLNRLSAANTHSLAWTAHSTQIYSFGIPGPWLGHDDDGVYPKQTCGAMSIECPSWMQGISCADCASEYSLLVFNTGYVGMCGVNEHGRMGVGKAIHSSSKIVWNMHLRDIVSCSAAAFHSGYVDKNGDVFTVGVGLDYRLGDGEENTVWIPKQIKACDPLDICQIECVDARTYAITTDGDLIMFGKEPVNGRRHRKPFIYNYLRCVRVYKVCGSRDFTVAFGVERKEAQVRSKRPHIECAAVDSMKPDQMLDETYRLTGDVLQQYHPKCVEQGNNVKQVVGTFVSMQQMQYDAAYIQSMSYAPPMNAVYVVPPPPPPAAAPVLKHPNPKPFNNNNNFSGAHPRLPHENIF
eukprot:78942_1